MLDKSGQPDTFYLAENQPLKASNLQIAKRTPYWHALLPPQSISTTIVYFFFMTSSL